MAYGADCDQVDLVGLISFRLIDDTWELDGDD